MDVLQGSKRVKDVQRAGCLSVDVAHSYKLVLPEEMIYAIIIHETT
jgi:hypothetical protein